MSIIRSLMQGLTASGRHRAIDRIPVLEAERDAIKAERDVWEAKARAAQAKLDHAEELVTSVRRQKNALKFENARLAAELEITVEANGLLAADLDELAARLIEARQDLANALAISSPAPADHGPAIALLDDTVETNVRPLWRVGELRTVETVA